MRFRLISGTHVEKDVEFQAGDIVESDIDLAKTFANKFEVVDDGPCKCGGEECKAEPSKDVDVTNYETEEPEEAGKDVTNYKVFAKASGLGLRVVKHGKRFTLIEGDSGAVILKDATKRQVVEEISEIASEVEAEEGE